MSRGTAAGGVGWTRRRSTSASPAAVSHRARTRCGGAGRSSSSSASSPRWPSTRPSSRTRYGWPRSGLSRPAELPGVHPNLPRAIAIFLIATFACVLAVFAAIPAIVVIGLLGRRVGLRPSAISATALLATLLVASVGARLVTWSSAWLGASEPGATVSSVVIGPAIEETAKASGILIVGIVMAWRLGIRAGNRPWCGGRAPGDGLRDRALRPAQRGEQHEHRLRGRHRDPPRTVRPGRARRRDGHRRGRHRRVARPGPASPVTGACGEPRGCDRGPRVVEPRRFHPHLQVPHRPLPGSGFRDARAIPDLNAVRRLLGGPAGRSWDSRSWRSWSCGGGTQHERRWSGPSSTSPGLEVSQP